MKNHTKEIKELTNVIHGLFELFVIIFLKKLDAFTVNDPDTLSDAVESLKSQLASDVNTYFDEATNSLLEIRDQVDEIEKEETMFNKWRKFDPHDASTWPDDKAHVVVRFLHDDYEGTRFEWDTAKVITDKWTRWDMEQRKEVMEGKFVALHFDTFESASTDQVTHWMVPDV